MTVKDNSAYRAIRFVRVLGCRTTEHRYGYFSWKSFYNVLYSVNSNQTNDSIEITSFSNFFKI